ncbi:MAG TPA: hypothetical protein DEB46_01300 [Myxococcales bacterium]|nr:hypothetical protein [Myxococcales bacterium]HBU46921.1 hypothetical protein [Myxococcales bacterium]
MKMAPLETTRLLLAIERAADLGATGVSLSELAHDFQLQPTQLRRALESLEALGGDDASPEELFDLEWSEEDHLRVHYLPGLDAPVPLRSEECAVLLMGLDLLGLEPDQARHLQGRLLARLDARAAGRVIELRQRLDVAPDHPLLSAVTEALEQKQCVSIHYDRGGGAAWRPVRPTSMTVFEGRVYIGAYCGLRQAPRVFRFDRILDLKPVEPFEIPTGQEISEVDLWGRVVRLHSADYRQTVVLRASDQFGEWALEDRYGGEARDSKGCYTSLVHPGEALAAWVVAQAGSVEVVEPSNLREGVARRARMLLETQSD